MSNKPIEVAKSSHLNRRHFLEKSVLLVAATAAASLSIVDQAQAKARKAAVNYQEQPKGGKSCANCRFFQPAKKACSRVEGEISANAWCSLWLKK